MTMKSAPLVGYFFLYIRKGGLEDEEATGSFVVGGCVLSVCGR